MVRHKFLSNEKIENIAESRIAEYEIKHGNISIPVPIEKIVQQVYGLTIDWDLISEQKGEVILGGLNPEKKLIVLNLKHVKLLTEEKPGLERFTIGHEAGHWEFDVDKALIGHSNLPGTVESDRFLWRSTEKNGQVSVFPGTTCSGFLEKKTGRDTPEQERVVNRFSGAMNMPRKLIRGLSSKYDLLSWPDLYKMQGYCGVTISALTVRLRQLNYIDIDENGKIYRTKDEIVGQKIMKF